ncbi:MAG: 6-phosphofructokinase [Sulfurimonadaceae bacterium]|nr:6-phosphofructokinase [Sulfurimonadaceae bacterium]
MGNIAIMCSGGDVSGMNPALKRFVEYSFEKGLTPYFVYHGYEGLIDNNIVEAGFKDVSGIITRGGTKIGSARSKRFMEPAYRQQAYENLKKLNIDKLVVLGGDGSFRGMEQFYKETGIHFCGIPSTIDNDINGTDYCLGVDTALNVIKHSIDAVRDTAGSFKRAFVIETMGRDCGYLALVSAMTSGAEMCLIPEMEYDLDRYKSCFLKEIAAGRDYFIAIVAEGLKNTDQIVNWFEEEIGFECRATILGHTQRGGNPTVYDRLMAYKFVTYAIDGLLNEQTDSVVCYTQSHFNYKSIDEVALNPYQLDPELIDLARSQYQQVLCAL